MPSSRLLLVAAAVSGGGLAITLLFAPNSRRPAGKQFENVEYNIDRPWRGPWPKLRLSADGKIGLDRTDWLSFHRKPPDKPGEYGPTRRSLTDTELSRLKELVVAVDWDEIRPKYTAKGILDGNSESLRIEINGRAIATSVLVAGQAGEPKELTALLEFLAEIGGRVTPPVTGDEPQ